ncbi:MAG: cobaltochelatase subunit CobN, partial [Caldilinea sp.]
MDTDFYHTEWERRKLRNKVHLSQGGCLGPCVLANVALLLMDGRPYWFHSINDAAVVRAMYDFIELLLDDANALPPAILRPHLFNGFGWDGVSAGVVQSVQPTAAPTVTLGNGILLLTQADTDLLTLTQARRQLPVGFAPVDGAHVGRLPDDAAVDALLAAKLPAAQIVVARVHSSRSFEHGLALLQRWAAETDGMLLCLPAVEAFDPDLMARSTVGIPLTQAISAYFQCGGVDNLVNGLQCLSDHLLVTGWGFEQPQELPLHGFYDAPVGCPACSRPEACHPDGCQPPTVGILFYRSHLLSGNTEFVDAIIYALHAHGLAARAIYTQSLKECDADGVPVAFKLMQAPGPVDVVISTLSFALSDKDAIFTRLDAPILQAITSSNDL